MRFQKLVAIFVLVGVGLVTGFCPSGWSQSRSSSNDDQLTELLRQKQAELDAQGNTSRKMSTPPAPAPQATKKQQKKEMTAPAQPMKMSAPAQTSASDDVLTDLLRRKQMELDQQSRGGVVTQPARPLEPTTPAGSLPPQRMESRPMKENTNLPVATSAGPSGNEDKLTQELRRKQAELDARNQAYSGAPRKEQNGSSMSKKNRNDSKSKNSGMNKAAAPVYPEPVLDPGSKAGRLDDLLRKYKADQITPHEYHMQRAKIIAEP